MTPAALAQRLRALRLTAGLTNSQASQNTQVAQPVWSRWESGNVNPRLHRVDDIVRGLGIPACALVCADDQVAVADVVLSSESATQVRRLGRPEAHRLASLLASQLEPLIYAAATRKVDTSPGARPKPRRSREQVLQGITAANKARAAALELRRQADQPGGEGLTAE